METETSNEDFYKYSENGIKNRNNMLWTSITNYNCSDITFKEKFYLYENKLLELPTCYCGKPVKFIDMISGFRKCCSKECMYSSKDISNKRKLTNIEKYGVDNPSKSDIIKEKVKESNLLKFGVEYPLQSKEIIEKSKKVFNEKYGVDNPSKVKEIREKAENTMLEKYGVKHAMLNSEIKEDLKSFFLEKYGVDNPSKVKEIREKAENTMLEKYGVKHAMLNSKISDKLCNTNLIKYGFKYYLQTDECKEKVKNTNLLKYGVDSYSKTDECKEKVKNTSLLRYGVDNYSKTDESKELIKNRNNEKYKKDHYNQTDDFHSKTIIGSDINFLTYIGNGVSLMRCIKGHNFKIDIDNYHKRKESNISICTICNPIGANDSIKEKDMFEYIKNFYSGEIYSSYRDGLEIDIYLPELKLGFEFNGLYWHSEKYKDKNYHLNKTNYFKEKGIRIIHIWEDDWDSKRDIIKSQIKNIINSSNSKLFARKCNIIEITDTKLVRNFLENNHIQGFVNSKVKIGLYHEDELVSIMVFDNLEGRKKMEDGGWNLSRFCNKLNTNIVGGASKLLKHFIEKYNPNRIISYADKDWSIGGLYYKIGFEKVYESEPDYKYIINSKRVHKSRYKKSNLGISNTTESKAMKELNINRIFDCGKIKFEYKF